MRSVDEIHAFYHDELLPEIERVEAARRERPPLLHWPRDGILLGLALLVSLPLRNLLPVWLHAGWMMMRLKPYLQANLGPRAALKRTLMERTIAFCDPSLSYDPFGRVPDALVTASGLFSEAYDRIGGEDLIAGKIGVTPFRCSELRLTRRRKKAQFETVFSGLFFAAEFHKSFRGQLIVLPDRLERRLGHLGRALQSVGGTRGLDLVELEDPEFEERFVVYGSDPVEARYILTPDLMQRIRGLGGSLATEVRIGFLRGYVFVALPLPGNLFGSHAWKGPVQESDVQAWVSELAFVTSLVEELDLNTRIWSRQPKPPELPVRMT